MFLDLASTIVGGVLVLVGESVLLVVVMMWALMDTGKKADEQMKEWDCKECPSYPKCDEICQHEWEA